MSNHSSTDTDSPIRIAVIRGKGHRDLDAVRRFLPSNYSADSDGGSIWIRGFDNAGWGLDTYVIPRLASGLWYAHEVTPHTLATRCGLSQRDFLPGDGPCEDGGAREDHPA